MRFDPSRLRRGELIVGASAAVLLVSMFAVDWYGPSGPLELPRSVNAWQGLSNLRWLLLLTVAAGWTLVALQGMRRAPALPVSVNVLLIVLSLVTALALVYRVLVNPPGPNSLIDQKAGAYVGLASLIVLLYGSYRSLRQEGVAESDGPGAIETVRLGRAPGS